MRTSSRFGTAVHVMAVLAYKAGEPVTSQFLAGSVNTNPVIIRRLLLSLQKARLVETKKGAGFGSRLARPAGKITLAAIYRAVELDEAFTRPPRNPNERCPVGQCIKPALEMIFDSAEKALQRELARFSLADIHELVGGKPGWTERRAA